MSKLFNLNSANIDRAYKVVIEPFSISDGMPLFDNQDTLALLAVQKLSILSSGYKKMFNEDLINGNSINWNTSTIIGDMDDENSLTFQYTPEWSQSQLSDIVGDFIPNNITAGVGKRLSKLGAAGGKLATGAGAYQGTFPAMNINDKKLLAKPTFLNYNLKIKVVDKDDTGEVLKVLTKLLMYSVPMTSDFRVTPEKVLEALKELANQVLQIASEAPGISDGIESFNFWKEQVEKIFGATVSPEKKSELAASAESSVRNIQDSQRVGTVSKNKEGGLLGEEIAKGKNTLASITELLTGFEEPRIELISAPIPIKIFVSDYFVHNLCIIQNVGVNLSKQITENGYPLFGTFDLSITSRELTTLDFATSDANNSSIPTVLRNIALLTNNTRSNTKPRIQSQ